MKQVISRCETNSFIAWNKQFHAVKQMMSYKGH